MCGQAGAYCTTSLAPFELAHVQKLLIANAFRGTDSTGVMWWRKSDNKYNWIKNNVHPFIFNYNTFHDELVKEDWKTEKPNLVAIHCRAATIGKVTVDNAHPFECDHIIGMHNGTISSNFEGKNKYDTDSEALYQVIAKKGIKEAISLLKHGSPAYALVWLDQQENTLNFLRNSMRPLHVFHAGSTIYWSSTGKDLAWVLDEGSTEAKTPDGIDLRKVMSLKVDHHYKVDLNQTGSISYTTEIVKPPEYVYDNSNFRGQQSFLPQSNYPKTTQTTYVSGAPSYVSVTEMDMKKGVDGIISEAAFEKPKGLLRQYSIEADGWVPDHLYACLLLWRTFHVKEFLAMANRNWYRMKKVRQVEILHELQMSRHKMKRLLKGTDTSYITEPFLKTWDGRKKMVQFYDYDLSMARRMFRNSDKEEEKSNVVPFDVNTTSPDLYLYGVDNLTGTEEELEDILDKGCTFCDDPVITTDLEDLFWMSNTEFLCPCCQDKALDGEYTSINIPYQYALPEFVQARRERNKEVPVNQAVILN